MSVPFPSSCLCSRTVIFSALYQSGLLEGEEQRFTLLSQGKGDLQGRISKKSGSKATPLSVSLLGATFVFSLRRRLLYSFCWVLSLLTGCLKSVSFCPWPIMPGPLVSNFSSRERNLIGPAYLFEQSRVLICSSLGMADGRENMAVEHSRSCGQATSYSRGIFSIPIHLLNFSVIYDFSACSGSVIGFWGHVNKRETVLILEEITDLTTLTFYLHIPYRLFIVFWTYTTWSLSQQSLHLFSWCFGMVCPSFISHLLDPFFEDHRRVILP